MIMLRRNLQDNAANVNANSNNGADESLAGVTVVDTENNVLEYEDGDVIDCDGDVDLLTVVQTIHCKIAFEQDGDDADGSQGGQKWQPPTKAPATPRPTTSFPTTSSPTTSSPTSNAPTETSDAPTPRGDPFVLRGLIWYDRNGNGKRDANVPDSVLGPDVERNLGLGGVQIQLTECDPLTNMALSEAQTSELYTDGTNSYASTISHGYNVLMHAMLIRKNDGGGKFELTNIKVARSYYVQVSAPMGYLFTGRGGVCNDEIVGWECPIYNGNSSLASDFVSSDSSSSSNNKNNNNNNNSNNNADGSNNRRRRLVVNESAAAAAAVQITNPNAAEPSDRDLDIGIRVGRSSKCVSIDAAGVPESRFDDLGVMRIGDLQFDETDVSLGVDMADVRRELLSSRGLDSHRKKIARDDGRYVYELADREAESIGEVTAEVIASRLDKALEEKGGVLDSVSHVDVTYYALDSEGNDEEGVTTTPTSSSSKTYSSRSNGRLEVNLKVRGHYPSDRNIDFDYIVEDSINRESSNIRTQMTSYNQQCKDQTAKITNGGYTVDDFSEVQSNYGIQEKRRQREQQAQQQQNTIYDQGDDERLTWSTACEMKRELPQFVEENLEALEARVIAQTIINNGGLSPLAIVGIVLGVGVVAFVFIFFLIRRDMTTTKKKRRETEWDEWSNDDTTDMDYQKSQPTGITGVVHHKMSNMTSALRSEWKRFRSGDDNSTIFNKDNNAASVRSSRSRGTNAKDHIKEKGDNSSAYSSSRRSREGVSSVSSKSYTSASSSRSTRSYHSSKYSMQSSTGSIRKSTQSEITKLESSLKQISPHDRSTTTSIGGSSRRSKASVAWSEYSSRGGGMNNSLGTIEEGSTAKNHELSSKHNERSRYAVPQITHADFDESSSDNSSFAAS